jgi:hypothetical protein
LSLVQSSRLSEEETMRLYDSSEELVAGAVVKALGGGDNARGLVQSSRLSEEETMRRAWCSRQGSQGRRRCEQTTARRRLSLGLVQSSRLSGEETMRWGLYNGLEEAVASLGDDTLAFTRGTVNQL